MHRDIERILLTAEEIKDIVSGLGRRISEDYADKNLLIVSILKGSFVFMADLIRSVDIPCRVDFIAVSSYGAGTETTGEVKIKKDLDINLGEYDILLVEDILDTGTTLEYISEMLKARNPRSVRICALLDKPERRTAAVKADYVGASVPDEFVAGYGLDYAERYRNLPYLGVLKPSVYGGK